MYIAGMKVDKEFDLEEIDKKVKYINENKKYCEETIRELNTLIDIDYIKMSEFIEGNTLEEIDNIDMEEGVKVMRSRISPIMDMPDDREERLAYLKKKKYDTEGSSLVIMKKGDASALDYHTFVCEIPKHLSAVEFALSRARSDRNLYQTGKGHMSKLDRKFIENINAKFFEKTEHKGETGYGSFRRIVYENGQWVVPNVDISGAAWKPIPCQAVPDEMESLIDNYNNSDIHPILKAIKFKTRFIKIHPFRDGNGRTSRILLNYMLVRYGYPTLTISGKEKYAYFNAMQKAITENNYTDILEITLRHLNERCDKYIQVINEQKTQSEECENY